MITLCICCEAPFVPSGAPKHLRSHRATQVMCRACCDNDCWDDESSKPFCAGRCD